MTEGKTGIPGSPAGLRVLVTGGAGFIGSEVVRQFVALGCNVTILDNFSSGKKEYVDGYDSVRIVDGDVADPACVKDTVKDQEIVVHLAALPFVPDSYYEPEQYFRVNATGTVTLILESIRSRSADHFVQVSSSEVYGTSRYIPMDEDHPTLPHSTYAVSKLAGDRAAFTMHKEHGFPVAILRPFNSYGPNITQPYIVPEIAVQIASGRSTIVLGNVNASRDFTYVSDTARGIVSAALARESYGEVLNLGTGRDVRIGDLARTMAKTMDRGSIKIEMDESRFRPYDVDRLVCDASKAKRLLNWEPVVTLEEGILRTTQWVLRHGIRFSTPFSGWSKTYREVRGYDGSDPR